MYHINLPLPPQLDTWQKKEEKKRKEGKSKRNSRVNASFVITPRVELYLTA